MSECPSGTLFYRFEGADQVAQFQRSQRKDWTMAAAVRRLDLESAARKIRVLLEVAGLLTLA